MKALMIIMIFLKLYISLKVCVVPGKTSDQFHPGLPNLSTLCWLPGKLNPFQTNFKFWVQFWATFNKHLIMMRSQRDIVENTSPPSDGVEVLTRQTEDEDS